MKTWRKKWFNITPGVNDNGEAHAIRFDFQIGKRSVSARQRRSSDISVSGFASAIRGPLPLSTLISERKMLFVLLVLNRLTERETVSRNSIIGKTKPEDKTVNQRIWWKKRNNQLGCLPERSC